MAQNTATSTYAASREPTSRMRAAPPSFICARSATATQQHKRPNSAARGAARTETPRLRVPVAIHIKHPHAPRMPTVLWRSETDEHVAVLLRQSDADEACGMFHVAITDVDVDGVGAR